MIRAQRGEVRVEEGGVGQPFGVLSQLRECCRGKLTSSPFGSIFPID